MPSGIAFLFPTVHASMLLYAAGLALGIAGRLPAARLASTLGCVLLFVHVGLAFHFVHHWDHADAVRQTAVQSEAVTGIRAGAGVYVNYLFMLAWGADVAYWWRAGHGRYRRRPPGVGAVLHGFLLFIVFNATVVFARPPTRWAAAAVFAGLAVLFLSQAQKRRSNARRRHPV